MAFKATNILTEAQKAKRFEEIRTLLKDLLKVFKVVSMYPPDNPLPQNMRRGLCERLAEHIEEYGGIHINVGRDTLTCEGETVYIDKSKEEALAALFFDTGITSLTFMESFDIENINKFLDVIKLYMNSPDKSQDLANLFWEAAISRFTFTTLEDIALADYQGDFQVQEIDNMSGSAGSVGTSIFGTDSMESYNAIFSHAPEVDDVSDSSEKSKNPDSDSGQGSKIAFRGGTRVSGGGAGHAFFQPDAPESDNPLADLLGGGESAATFNVSQAAEAMGFTGLPSGDGPSAGAPTGPRANTQLILNDELRLSEEDEKAVAVLVSDDAEFDMWESTMELCKELLHQENELPDFAETVGICSKVATELMSAGKLLHTGQLLQYMHTLEDQIRKPRPAWADRLADARQTFGSRDRMEVLGQTLNSYPAIGADELRRYLTSFDWQALAAITDLLGELQNNHHREAVCDYLTTTGKKHLPILSRGVTDKRPQAVRGAIIVLARIGDAQSFGILKKAAENENRAVRLELVTQLKDCPGPETLAILKIAALDKDAEIRQASIASIAAQSGTAAFEIVGEIISNQAFALLEYEDKARILTAYSTLGGDEAVSHLGELIRTYNPLKNPILVSNRRASFEALIQNRTDRAERLLVQLSNSWRPDIRKKAQSALKRRRELIFGGTDE